MILKIELDSQPATVEEAALRLLRCVNADVEGQPLAYKMIYLQHYVLVSIAHVVVRDLSLEDPDSKVMIDAYFRYDLNHAADVSAIVVDWCFHLKLMQETQGDEPYDFEDFLRAVRVHDKHLGNEKMIEAAKDKKIKWIEEVFDNFTKSG